MNTIPSTQTSVLHVGHSPDADDAFMFYALSQGAVQLPQGYRIEHVIEDIESLNHRAFRKELEVTAISAAVYPYVADHYWIWSAGASVGRNYGPIVVTKTERSLDSLRGKKIAHPGDWTTAYLLSRIFLPEYQPVAKNFDAVMNSVTSGEVDAGIIIHEGQLNFGNYGVQVVADLGKIWFDKYRLPIPLGLDVVRKDLGRENAFAIGKALKASIHYAMEHRADALEYAARYGRGTLGKTLDDFVGMYVNQDTVDMGSEGAQALTLLFQEAAQRGIFKTALQPEILQL